MIASLLVCRGQIHPITHFSTKDILPHNTVRSLHLTEEGVLWIGTDNGLVRKQNNSIRTYFKEDGLPLNNIWVITEDNYSDLWVGSYGNGIAHFDGSEFTMLNAKDGLIHNDVVHMRVFGDFIYVGTSDGISIINIPNKEVVASVKHGGQSMMRVSGFFEFENVVYATTYNTGIYKISVSEEKYSLQKISDHQLIYDSERIGDSLYASNKGAMSVIAVQDLVNEENPEFKEKKGMPIFWDFAKTKEDVLYGASWGVFEENGGVFKFSECGKHLEKIIGIDSKQIVALTYNPVLELLFVGTLDNGVFQVSLNATVQFYPSKRGKTLALNYFDKSEIKLYDDGVEIASRSYDAHFFKQQKLAYVAVNKEKLPKYDDFFYELNYDTAASDIVFYGIKKSHTHVWINTNIGLYKFRPNGDFDSYLPIHTLQFDFTADNRLIETNPFRGVRIYESEYPLKYTYYSEMLPTTPTDIVGTFRTGTATYFLSIFNGLLSYDGKFESFLESGIWDESKLRHSAFYKDFVAISNEFGDVYILDFKDQFKVLKKISRSEIRGNTILFLNAYKDWLIIGTERGILFYNEKKQIFINEDQGITKPLYAGHVYEDVLYVGTVEGEYQVDLQRLVNAKDRVDDLFVARIRVNNKDITVDNHLLNLNAKQNNLEIRIATNTHPYPNKLAYYYKMKDHSDWVKLESPEIELSFLEPSDYDVSVLVNDIYTGQLFEKSILKFTIQPPFYDQWWFRFLVAISLVFLTSLYFDRKRRQQKIIAAKEIEANKRIVKLKTEALLAQMNPHFIFNALNSIQHLVVVGENKKASRYLVKFSNLVRSNLINSDRTFISLEEELKYLKTYCEIENERHGNRIAITFDIDPKIDRSETEIPNLILQPFLENAFVHAFAQSIKSPELTLTITQLEGEKIKCVIRDNGVGSKKTNQTPNRTSKGISLIKERLHFLNYNVDVALNIAHTAKGTCITLIL